VRTILEHTADVRLRVEADTPEDLFREAMLGMFEVMSCSAALLPAFEERRIEVAAPDRTSLLVDFLNEVLSLAHIEKACFGDVKFDRLTETEAVATLTARKPARFEQDVKAVTYHEAEVRCERAVWSTMLVFDI
jgi:SHS2 domain-containing protein